MKVIKLAAISREQTIARLRYGREHATWMFAVLGAALFYIVARLLGPKASGLVPIGTILGVSFGLVLSRLYIAIADGILILIEDSNDR